MGESTESIILRLRLDAAEVDAGTAVVMSKQRAAAREYASVWESALAKKDASERAELEASFLRYQENNAKKAASDAAYFAARKVKIEEQAAVQSIANGSGAFGSIEAAAAGGGAIVKEAKAVEGEAHGFAGIMRETAVIFREGLRGNWTRMLGSATLLIGYIGAMAAAVAIPLAAILAIPGYRAYKANKGAEESDVELKEAQKRAEDHLRPKLEKMRKDGFISEKQFESFQERIKGGDIDAVMQEVNRVSAGGVTSEDKKEIARINKETYEEQLAAYRATVPLLTRIQSLEIERHEIQQKQTKLKKDSVDYAQNEHDISKLTLDINRDQAELAEKKKELQKQYSSDIKERGEVIKEMGKVEFESPTIEDLAGRGFTSRLNKQYGKGGRFDLGAGDGPFAGIAQDYELAQKQQIWDRIHGNAGAAEGDRQRMIADRNALGAAGLDTPAMKMAAMNDHLTTINSNIADLLTAAQKDGIKLKD